MLGHYVIPLRQPDHFFNLMTSAPKHWEPSDEPKLEDLYLFWRKLHGNSQIGDQIVMLFEVRTPSDDDPVAQLESSMRRWLGRTVANVTSPRRSHNTSRQEPMLPLYGLVSVGVCIRFFSLHGYFAPLTEFRPRPDGAAWDLLHDCYEIHDIFKGLFAGFVRDAMGSP